MNKGTTLLGLHIHNGLTIEDAYIPLDKQGMVFLRGKNYDVISSALTVTPTGDIFGSNGSAKSAPWDLLQHIGFGTTSRGTQRDEIVRSGENDGLLILLEMSKEDGYYLASQSRGHKVYGDSVHAYKLDSLAELKELSKRILLAESLESLDDDREVTHKKNQKEAQAFIADSIIEKTLQQWCGSVYLSQEAGHPLVNGTPTECAKYISSTFGYDVYDDIRARLKEMAGQYEEQATKADVYLSTIHSLEEKLNEYGDYKKTAAESNFASIAGKYGHVQLKWLMSERANYHTLLGLAKHKEQLLINIGNVNAAQVEDDLALKRASFQKLQEAIRTNRNNLDAYQKASKLRKEHGVAYNNWQFKLHLLDVDPLLKTACYGQDVNKTYCKILSDWLATASARKQSLQQIHLDYQRLTETRQEVFSEFDADGFDFEQENRDWEEAINNYQTLSPKFITAINNANSLETVGASCPLCGQTIDDNHKGTVHDKAERATKQLAALTNAKELALDLSAKFKQFVVYKQKLKRIVDDSRAAGLLDPSTANSERQTLNDAVTAITSFYGAACDLSNIKNSLNSLTDEQIDPEVVDRNIALWSEASNDLGQEIATLQSNLHSISVSSKIDAPSEEVIQSCLQAIEYEIEELTSVLQNNQNHQMKLFSDVGACNVILRQLDRAKLDLEEHKHARHKSVVLKTLIKGVAKLKIRRLHDTINLIRNTLTKYTDVMFDEKDMSFEIDDSDAESIKLMCVRTYKDNGQKVSHWIPVKGMSKGERARLRVCLIWTIREIVGPDNAINLLVLDEADGGLDDHGLEAYCTLLEQISKEYETVVVISHRPELAGVKFDQTWTMTKLAGVSKFTIERNRPTNAY